MRGEARNLGRAAAEPRGRSSLPADRALPAHAQAAPLEVSWRWRRGGCCRGVVGSCVRRTEVSARPPAPFPSRAGRDGGQAGWSAAGARAGAGAAAGGGRPLPSHVSRQRAGGTSERRARGAEVAAGGSRGLWERPFACPLCRPARVSSAGAGLACGAVTRRPRSPAGVPGWAAGRSAALRGVTWLVALGSVVGWFKNG